jgi:large subunit ribosomal protein L32
LLVNSAGAVPAGGWGGVTLPRLPAAVVFGEPMVPVKKTSKCRKRKRRSHHALRRANLVSCPKCSKMKLPHAACGRCGYVSPKLALPVGEIAA